MSNKPGYPGCMDMEVQRFKELARKYAEGKLTDQQKATLEAWYLEHGELPIDISPEKITAIGRQIFQKLPGNSRKKITGFILAAAAVSITIISLIIALLFNKPDMVVNNLRRDIPPGGNRAVLTLANGKVIDLEEAANGPLAVQHGTWLVKNSAGQLVYEDHKDGGPDINDHENNIRTPEGGIWALTLSDGTKVWLNNSTSLTFPASFRNRGERRISLAGEAYFEVAKDRRHPFIVQTRHQELRVLGTHFNIRAFADEPQTSTALLEGSVTVSSSNQRLTRILRPGKLSMLTVAGMSISNANTEAIMAWKNGYFRFDNTPVEQVMRELARWYGIEVYYEGEKPREKLNGRISRNKNISQVLSALRATKIIHFKVEGRRVMVMK
ncbi:FecR family protein [Mucilaginibacter sp. SG538B]|uniref:FecR family protein n=1 Tax=Mucilaginibacter sp. SG538B TaxID=2587021 RepID=UPI00159CF5E4|nr:FecR family protein [Mucilaginibacter sp. SG538B]